MRELHTDRDYYYIAHPKGGMPTCRTIRFETFNSAEGYGTLEGGRVWRNEGLYASKREAWRAEVEQARQTLARIKKEHALYQERIGARIAHAMDACNRARD